MSKEKRKATSLWSKALFLEGIRQTKWIAITGLILCGLLLLSDSINSYSYINGYAASSVMSDLSVISFSFSYLAVPLCYLFITVIMFRLFSFLNRRSASDFYYSVCEKRITVFFTYCTVVFLWAFIFIIFIKCLQLGNNLLLTKTIDGYDVMQPVFMNELFTAFGVMLGCIMLIIGALSIGMSTTGNGLTNILTMLIILFAPRFIISYYLSGYYDIMPYLTENETIATILSNKVNLLYSYFGGTDIPFWIQLLYSMVLGGLYLVIGGVAFCRRKSEIAGTGNLNRFWQLILRLAVSLMMGISASVLCADWIIQRENADSSLSSVILFYFVAVFVWVLFEFITTRKIKSVLNSLKQLPVFVVLNALIVISLLFAANITSKVPDREEVDAVYVYDFSVSGYDYYSEHMLYDLLNVMGEVRFTDAKAIDTVYTQLENDMIRFRDSSINYELDAERDSVMTVAIEVDGTKTVRIINCTTFVEESICNHYADVAANIYDYELPIAPIATLSYEEDAYEYFGASVYDGYSFAWDFSQEELVELYNCFYKEVTDKEYPLKTFLGRNYNKEGVFDFLVYEDYRDTGSVDSKVDLPIGLNTPETLEKLANMGNHKRTDFDFDWFIDYIKNIGNQEKGATLEVILYAGDGNNIRYESFSWWGNYTADMSNENLLKLQEVVAEHKNDDFVSSEGNLLMLVYKNIDGVDTTGRWFNLTDEEAAIVDAMIWKDGYFERYKYFNYY